MNKATSAILLLTVALVLVQSEPLRQRFVPRRGLARQEQAAQPSPAPTGYPEAGITPEVPFDLPSSAQPEVSYLPPDNTYGPPDTVYEPPTSIDEAAQPEPVPEEEQPIDDIPPVDAKQDAVPEEEEVIVQVAEDGTVISVSTSLDKPDDSKSARFYQRFPQSRRREQPVPQRLVLRRSW